MDGPDSLSMPRVLVLYFPPIRFVKFHGKSENRRLLVLKLTKGPNSSWWPKEAKMIGPQYVHMRRIAQQHWSLIHHVTNLWSYRSRNTNRSHRTSISLIKEIQRNELRFGTGKGVFKSPICIEAKIIPPQYSIKRFDSQWFNKGKIISEEQWLTTMDYLKLMDRFA